jgi:hypothetical protein
MQNRNFEFRVLVAGKPVTEYSHEGNIFIEGRKGSEFEIEFINMTSKKLLVIPSVDGLSPINGSSASPDSMGYIANSQSKLVIPGWTLDNKSIAKFLFQDKEKTIGSDSTNTSASTGVLGILVYSEYEQPVDPKREQELTKLYEEYQEMIKRIEELECDKSFRYPRPWVIPTQIDLNPWKWPQRSDPIWCTNTRYWQSPICQSNMNHINCNTSIQNPDLSGYAQNTVNEGNSSVGNIKTDEVKIFEMSADFGAKQDFEIKSTQFNRGDLLDQVVIFYDSRRNLSKRGIEVTKKENRYSKELPQAFIGIGCKPPTNWKG